MKKIVNIAGVSVEVERRRVKNLNLRVRADGTAHLSVPWHTSDAQAMDFLGSKAEWLRRAAARRSEPDLGADGRVPLWGALVELPGNTTAAQLYARETLRRLPEVVTRMEAATGLHAAHWTVRDMSTRWGSCTPRTARIRINPRLAAYPPTCLDYVVAHELTHLAEPSHNARFHALLAKAFPCENEARRLLRTDPRSCSADPG